MQRHLAGHEKHNREPGDPNEQDQQLQEIYSPPAVRYEFLL